jgi:hypothetical protein
MEPSADFEPDIIDLQSWICTATDVRLSKVWESTKYLSSPYEIWLYVWKSEGRPNISMESLNP